MPLFPPDDRSSIIGWLQLIAASSKTPSRSAMRRERVNAVRKALEDLPLKYRQAVRYRYLDDMSLAEVAERMKKSKRTVRGLIYEALDKIEELLGSDYSPSGPSG